jgi:crossover junction endodeoxyribonuclease RuvC
MKAEQTEIINRVNNRIIGIDPGSRYTGVAVIEKQGSRLLRLFSTTIVAVKADKIEEKLRIIFTEITKIIEEYQPANASVERIFHSVNPHSSLILGHARGVSLLALELQRVRIYEYAPTEVKSAVVGVGRASKDQVNAMVKVLLNLDRTQKLKEDEADALAIAICHAHTSNYQALIKNN